MNNEFELDSLLKQMAASHRSQLPSPGMIWWRAQVLRKQKEKERIERPLMIMRGVAAVACVAALVVFLVNSWGQLEPPMASRLAMPLVVGFLMVSAILAFVVSWSPAKESSSR
jgi:hypothetical protein